MSECGCALDSGMMSELTSAWHGKWMGRQPINSSTIALRERGACIGYAAHLPMV
jgi:hypothetical protein